MKEGVMVSRASVDFKTIKEMLIQDDAFVQEYEKLKPRYEVIAQIIAIRNELNMTQEQLADRMNTKKSNISRLERGTYNPSLDYMVKVAKSLGKEIHIELRDAEGV
jgi:DNA-binding XRE family transcriptional regulator